MRTKAERDRLDAIAAHYAAVMVQIENTPANRWAIDPYAWTELVNMTPIEQALWSDIRSEGAVMYPQFPVAGYFVDFANPAAKVAIECDGKRWHLDKEKDAERQDAIEAQGWSVYRITGSDCKRCDDYEEDENGREILILGPARRLIRDIAERHGIALCGVPA